MRATSALSFVPRLPRDLPFEDCLLIYDRRLRRDWGAWIRLFPRAYAVKSGEGLKDLRAFPMHAEKILRLSSGVSPKKLTVVAFGGGSVGDFAGFVASVVKRGVRLAHVPSTWLAAIDSAHGGKTALNANGAKNQIGTFYPASRTYLVRDVLLKLGQERFHEAWPEAVKVALLDGPRTLRPLSQVRTPLGLWRMLPNLIRAKMRIVRRDPQEQKGIRHLLNFGHTVGHLIEIERGLPHGTCVGYGLTFALQWSREVTGLKEAADLIERCDLPSAEKLAEVLSRLRNSRRALLQDKKMATKRKVRFVFLRAPGRPMIREIPVVDVLQEIRRQS